MPAIEFISIPEVNDTVSFSYYPDYPDESSSESIEGIFKVFRLDFGQVSIASNVPAQATAFANAYNFDYAPILVFTVVGNTVMIECANGSPIFGFTSTGSFAALVMPQINNTIHIINFTPRKYAIPLHMQRAHLLTENGLVLTTESGKQIKL